MVDYSNVETTTNPSGRKVVVIPLEEWENIQEELNELRTYKEMKSGLKTALLEVEAIKKGKLPRKTLRNFLDEIN